MGIASVSLLIFNFILLLICLLLFHIYAYLPVCIYLCDIHTCAQ